MNDGSDRHTHHGTTPEPSSGQEDAEDHSGHSHDHGHEHRPSVLERFTGLFRAHSHDVSDNIDDALAGSLEGIKVVKISLLGLGITALLQIMVVLISGSVALLADTIHNFSDASTALPLWLAFSLSRRPSNRRYTYGYGRAEDIAGLSVVLLIAASAAFAASESIKRLLDPQPVAYLGWVAAAALVGFIGNEAVAHYRIRAGRRIGSAALVADGYHARVDGITSLAVLLSAAGAWAGFPLADPLVGLGITVVILFILKDAARQIWRRLMDAIEPEILERAEAAARTASGVEDVSMVRARWIGHSLHAEMHVIADCYLTLSEAHAVAERARHAVLHEVPKLYNVMVHVDPCGHDGLDPHEELAHHDLRPVNRHVHSVHS